MQKNNFSSIIEIIGIKEDAEFDPEVFLNVTTSFRLQIESTLNNNVINKLAETDQFSLHIFRDYCYVQSSFLEHIFIFLKELRVKFFNATKTLFRSVVTTGVLEIEYPREKKLKSIDENIAVSIKYLGFGEIPSKLYGIMERFKGVGILIDESVLKNYLNKDIIDNYTFTNFYVASIGNKLIPPKFQIFTDIIISGTDDLQFVAKDILDVVGNARLSSSRKLARFYIPFLINMCRHLSFSHDKKSNIDSFIGSPEMNKCKDVPGIELVYLTILNRLYGDEKLSVSAIANIDRIKAVEKAMAKISTIADLLRIDSSYSNIPSEIISNSAKRIALKSMVQINSSLKK